MKPYFSKDGITIYLGDWYERYALAKELGRKAIGIEIEERYCEIAAKRIDGSVLLRREKKYLKPLL